MSFTSDAAKAEREKRFHVPKGEEVKKEENVTVIKKAPRVAHPEKIIKSGNPKEKFISLIKRKLRSGDSEFTEVQLAAMKTFNISLKDLEEEIQTENKVDSSDIKK